MFRDQNVLITGASSGIGLELARLFAREGARLALVARREDRLTALVSRLCSEERCPHAVSITADLRQPEAPPHVYTEAVRALGQVDVLVNNAGIGEYGRFVEKPLPALHEMLRLNIDALVSLTHLAARDMVVRRAGRIMNIASMAAFQPTPYMGLYGATKALVLHFSLALDAEIRKEGVPVTCVCPGGVRTEFLQRGGYEARSDFAKYSATPDQVARAALDALRRRGRICVPGTGNAMIVAAERLLPLRWVTKISARVLRPKP